MSKFLTDRARTLPVIVVAVVIAVAATLVILLAGPSTPAGGGSQTAASGAVVGGKGKKVSIAISMFKFSPSRVTIAPGTTVSWTNNDTTEHTATADNATTFDTAAIQKGQTKTFTFTKAGTYAYHCAFHPFMTATVVVR